MEEQIIEITVDETTEVVQINITESVEVAVEFVQEILIREYASATIDGGVIF